VGVDPQSRNAILEAVEQLSSSGMAVLYTTHYMEEAERLCDRVGIIDQGQLKAEGNRRGLVALVGERDRIHVEASGHLELAVEAIRRLPGVGEASSTSRGIEILAVDAALLLPEVLRRMAQASAGVSRVLLTIAGFRLRRVITRG
jgi:ABC-2 type transport system ATP-binding protein